MTRPSKCGGYAVRGGLIFDTKILYEFACPRSNSAFGIA